MPLYTYRNPNTNESIDVIQRMSDEHVYVDDDGLQWERVWSIPQATMGLNNSADSESQFIDKTKGWTAGEMWDYSKEMSEKRTSSRGYDHVKDTNDKKRQDKIDSYKPSKRKAKAKKTKN